MSRSYFVGGRQITIGASTVATITATPFWQGTLLGKVGASLAGATFDVALVDGVTFSWTQGYELSDNERISVDGPAQFYVAAGGVTAIIQIAPVFTAGATQLNDPPIVPGGLIG